VATTREGAPRITAFTSEASTYIEFFGDPVPEGEHLGHVGMGLAVERAAGGGDCQKLRTVFREKVKTPRHASRPAQARTPAYTDTYVVIRTTAACVWRVAENWIPAYPGAEASRAQSPNAASGAVSVLGLLKADRLMDDVVGFENSRSRPRNSPNWRKN